MRIKSNQVRYEFIREKIKEILKKESIVHSPVNIELLISNYCTTNNIELHLEGKEFKPQCSGMYIFEKTSKILGILYNSTHHIHRQRFTIGHEFGHFVLGHSIAHNLEEAVDIGSKDPIEVEANYFSSLLLMPTSILKKQVKNLTNLDYKKLADLYNVSPEAMKFRLISDGEIIGYEEEYLDRQNRELQELQDEFGLNQPMP